jgi:hypothetical protein
MPVKITSLLTSRPIIVPLTSGTAVRLSPGQTSEELGDVEVENNPKVDKLQQQRVIAVENVEGGGSESSEGEVSEPAEAIGGVRSSAAQAEPSVPGAQ